jgi:hypothetical protein
VWKGVFHSKSNLQQNRPARTPLTLTANRRDRLLARMSGPSDTRVFISYARKDGAALAAGSASGPLCEGLRPLVGYTAPRRRRATWPTEIERAIDTFQLVLALMTTGPLPMGYSLAGDICPVPSPTSTATVVRTSQENPLATASACAGKKTPSKYWVLL